MVIYPFLLIPIHLPGSVSYMRSDGVNAVTFWNISFQERVCQICILAKKERLQRRDTCQSSFGGIERGDPGYSCSRPFARCWRWMLLELCLPSHLSLRLVTAHIGWFVKFWMRLPLVEE